MSPLPFRFELEDGQSIDLAPTVIHPLGLAELRALLQDVKKELELQLEAFNPIVNGTPQEGHATISAKVTLFEPATIYSLVQGGWLPLPFAIPPRFLVDRNVVIKLKKLRLGQTFANGQTLEWWTKFFAQGTAIFSPLPYAIEAGYRRNPTKAEFIAAYEEGASELANALPNCHIVKFGDANFANAPFETLYSHYDREMQFLCEICPLISDRVPRSKESELSRLIIDMADRYQVRRGSLVTLAVLSCLYDDVHGAIPSIGRKLLKPKRDYTESDAYNALSDLRHIEFAATGQAYFEREAFALCTCDQGLTSLWCALGLRGKSSNEGAITLTFDFTTDLFPRLAEAELLNLKNLLRARPLPPASASRGY